MTMNCGREMYALAERLFPICRSITGAGVRETLSILKERLPGIAVHEIPTGTKCLDWTVPKEWSVKDAYVIDPNGRKILSFKESNLRLVGYSTAINTTMSLEQLNRHLHSLPEQPDAIPYVTSYYAERWGFCLSENERLALVPGDYHVVIDSLLFDGHLTYGELIVPGDTAEEIFLSTYICHPSLGNNELSGPVVTSFLCCWLKGLTRRHYTYRIVFIPETIGSIVYISKMREHLIEKVVAGFNVTCVGDDRTYSYLPSRRESSLADRAALHVLKHLYPDFKRYTYLDRGSDERQYCSPGINLPMTTIMRSKYGEYPEYHTSLDNLDVISPAGLQGGFESIRRSIEALEVNKVYRMTVFGEPQLGKRGLYPTISTKGSATAVRTMMNLIAYCDGSKDLLAIADIIGSPIWELTPLVHRLVKEGLLQKIATLTESEAQTQPQ